MLVNYFKIVGTVHRTVALILVISVVGTLIPSVFFGEDGLSTVHATEFGIPEALATTSLVLATSTTAVVTSVGTSTATSTESGTAESETLATTTATTTPVAGASGQDGVEGTAGATPSDEVVPVAVVSDALIGDVDAPEAEDTTGFISRTGTNTLIETGIATAQGELSTNANSNDIRSELGNVLPLDLDTYTFTATGSNDAVLTNNGLARSISGDNYARGRSTARILSGDAVATFNVANVINTNVVNSDGFIYLANQILEEGESLNLSDSFFPDVAKEQALSERCSLLSCASEDILYNVSQKNHATITNDVLIEAITGNNEGDAALSLNIATGDAYAAANVLNVVNSNIIDSNYRLLTYNAVGNLDGDLILPTEELFDMFFSRPNGINQLESPDSVQIHAVNQNDAIVSNNLEAVAETGVNVSTTDFDSTIVTGRAESESNILNKIDENVYGGDSMYILIRVHGNWNGEVVGLPQGLTSEWTPLGIVIYNSDAEIAPSAFLGRDIDSYKANFANNNRVALENNVTLNATTGKNDIDGVVGVMDTGDAFASANVMNIANTNIIGTNWTMAVINILGDFEGNVSFESTDIALAGTVSASKNPLGPEDVVTYTYTVINKGKSTATNVVLDQSLQFAHANTNETTQRATIGTLARGASKNVVLTAKVNATIPYGSTPVVAHAVLSSDQGDIHASDNSLQLSIGAFRGQASGTGTTTGNGTGNPVVIPPVYAQGAYSGGAGGGGGGGNSTKKTGVKREEVKTIKNAKAVPLLTVKKVAVNVVPNKVVQAGTSVDYKITVTNDGGNAYDVQVFDMLTNPIEAVVSEQSWDLGTVLAGESINLTYTTEYNALTPSGTYTNTARVQAYRKEGMKARNELRLTIKNAVHTVEVKGVDLAVGNVAVLAYFLGVNGKTSALLVWETSRPSVSQLFYGPTSANAPYSPSVYNFGYQSASFTFPEKKTKHAVIITDLQAGRTHGYRINAVSDKYKTTSREYLFTLPLIVAGITLPSANSFVAGVATSTPAPSIPSPVRIPTLKSAPPKTRAPAPPVSSTISKPKQVEVAVPIQKNFGFLSDG